MAARECSYTTFCFDIIFFYAAACSACRSHAAFSTRHASASPAHRASLRLSRASPVGCCRVRPHPTTLKADVSFFYAAACSACRRQRGFVLPPCGRITSRPSGASSHALRAHHLTPCGRIPSPPALAPGAVSASAHTQVTACFDYV